MNEQGQIIAVFDVPGMTAEQYEQIIQALKEAGQGPPDGRLYHVTGPTEVGWLVVDIWESAEKFRRFGQDLMPIAQAAGTDPQPRIYPVHNLVAG